MFTSFSTALSALNATSTAIDVVGNNLANLNTTGYKASVVSFHDLVTQSLGAGLGETQVGFGVAPPITLRQFTQGAVQAASGSLDAAIQGDGFFVVNDLTTNSTLYTRDGHFQVDANGNLLTSTGQAVQGWTLTNGSLDTNSATSNIKIPVGSLRSPVASTACSIGANLNASATAGASSGTFSTTIPVTDSLGNPLNLTVTFTKDASTPLQWNYQVTIPSEAVGGTAGTTTALLATPGAITFDSTGMMVTPASTDGPIALSITGLADNAADLNINWSLYDSGGSPLITQYSESSATSATSADGVPAAQLVTVALADGGKVMAQYSNGTQLEVAQVALASVRNPESLVAVGSNNYQASANTALPAVGIANTGGRGQILGGSLESSTVDIAKEFTDLIVLQRAYEANSKVVTTVDQLSQATINLKQG
jgi:flagellar hook protein FlgE